jgi:hypothetical protein
MIRRVPVIWLVAVLAAAPAATCLLAVRAHSAMAMTHEEDCSAPRADQAPTLCSSQMVAASGPAGMAFAPADAMPARAYALRRPPDIIPRVTLPIHDTGPPGVRPAVWLRHNAFLI